MTDTDSTRPLGETAVATAEQLAQLFNCSAYNVRQLAVAGTIPKVDRGKYPVVKCIRAYTTHLRALATGKGEGTASGERKRLASAQADLVQLKARKASGELVEAALVQEQWVRVMSTLRARLLAIPSRVGSSGAAGGHTIAELDREIRAALEELADDGETPPSDHPPSQCDPRPSRPLV